MKNANLPAAPIGQQLNMNMVDPDCNGLTKREHFAAMAMQGLLADPTYADVFETAEEWRKNIAEASVEFAECLLAELEK